MKNLLIIAVASILLITSCRYSDCTNPNISLDFKLDSNNILIFKFNTYEKGGGFTKLISSDIDTAHIDSTNYRRFVTGYRHSSIDGTYDYIIEIPETSKTYSISNISYSGKKRVKDGGILSENKTACTRTVNYTVNAQNYTAEGDTYEKGWRGPKKIEITITQ